MGTSRKKNTHKKFGAINKYAASIDCCFCVSVNLFFFGNGNSPLVKPEGRGAKRLSPACARSAQQLIYFILCGF